MKKYLLSVLFITSLLFSNLFAQAEITTRLSDALAEASKSGDMVRSLIMLKDQVDIQNLNKQLYDTEATLEERAYIVITTLQDKANATQGSLLEYLDNKYTDEVSEYRSYWITNMVFVEALPTVIMEIAERNEIGVLDLDGELEWDKPVSREPAAAKSPGGIEPGLAAINAPAMWRLGFTGAGRVVMNDDTGVDGNHPALNYKWRGAQPGVPASAAWFSWNGSTTFPVDGDGHGTHTMGTMCGLEVATSDTVGVAPGAQWIASDALFGSPHTSYSIAAWQWAVDPDGNPGTIDDMPDAIGNSWWDPNIPDNSQCDPALNPYINAYLGVEAAGIAIIFSAGNSGPSAQSVTSPKNVNIDEVTFWATGAVNGNIPGYPIASFSSRGPVVSACSTGTPSLDIKPEASAPGENVRSSTGGSYASFSGTSMACPHVVGAIALLREAVPTITGWEAKQALYNTAVDLGDPGEDNTYGMGIIDVYAAYVSLADPTDPNAPENFTAYSDYNTPTSMLLNWTDPSTYFNGDPLTNFQIYVYRDGAQVASVASGAETYTDMGLTDGQAYAYSIMAADIPNDSTSTPVLAAWTAGGSAVPGAPTVFSVTNASGGDLNANWTAPTMQVDGTPLDDYAGVYLYENGTLLTTFTRTSGDTGMADTEVFTPTTTNAEYWVTAFDNEIPINESAMSNSAFPPYSAPYLENFENAVVGTPGTLPVQWTNETGDDMDWYVDDGGTPSTGTGPTVDHTLGTAAGKYLYTEATGNFNSTAILTTPTIDISSLTSPGLAFWYHMFGATMGELHIDVYHDGVWNDDVYTLTGQQQAAQTDPWLQAIVDLSAYTTTPIQVRFRGITGTSFTSDMAIDDVAFTSLTNNPLMAVTPTAVGDTLLVGALDTLHVNVANNQALPSSLNFTATESPDVGWLDLDPTSGVIPSSQNMDINFAIDASGLTAGTYNTQVIIAGDDSTNPSVTVDVTLLANDAPVISINPDTFYVAVAGANTEIDTMTISNNGSGPLYFTIETQDLTEGLEFSARVINDERKFNKPVKAPAGIRSLLPEVRTISNESDELNPRYEDEEFIGYNTNYAPILNNFTEDIFIFGTFSGTFSGGTRDRGNYYEMTETVQLREHWFYLDISTSGDIYFFVYEGSAFTGTYNLIDVIHDPNSGSGEQWYYSGPTNVTLYAGNFYYIGAAWIPSATYGRSSDPVPVAAPWGNLYSGNPGTLAGAPPTASINSTRTTPFDAQYYQALDISTSAEWLTVDPDSGMVAAMSSVDIELTFDASGLNGGDYFAQVNVNSNDPVNPSVSAGVQMHVIGEPGIAVAPQTVDWGSVFTNVVDTSTFYVINSGSDSLHVSGMTNSAAEFIVVGPTSFVLAIGDSQGVEVAFTSAVPGTFVDSVLVMSDATNDTPYVYLNAMAIDPPIIGVDPMTLTDSLLSGQSAMHYFDVFNDGASPLYFEIDIEDVTTVESVMIKKKIGKKAEKVQQLPLTWTTLSKGASVHAEQSPNEQPRVSLTPSIEAIWDLQFFYDVDTPSGLTGIAGAETDGTFLYGTKWSGAGEIVKFDLAGNFIETFTIPGVVNLRDLAYDGQYFYGSDASSYIWQMDFDTRTLISTITTPASVRALAYDSDLDGFWYNNFSTDLHFVDRSGTLLSTISAPPSMYGCAYDNLSDGGPYLWIFTGTTTGLGCQVEQYDLATQTLTGVTHSVSGDLGDYIAGGLFLQPNLVSGTYTLGGLAQGTPDLIFGYELGEAGAAWVSVNPAGDTVAVGDTAQVAVTFDAAGLIGGLYEAELHVNSNDPVTPTVTVDASLHVTGVANIAVDPTILDFGFLFLGVSDTLTFEVQNPGTADLNVSGLSTSTPEFSVLTSTPFTVTPGGAQSVEVLYSAAVSGVHSDSVVVTHDAPIVLSDVVMIAGETANPPVMVMGDTLMQHQVDEGQTDSLAMWMYNQGASMLDYELVLGDDPFMEAASYAGQSIDPSVLYSGKMDYAPAVEPGLSPSHTGEAIWDVQLTFDLEAASGALGNAGAEFDGTYFYSTRWASNLLHQYDATGALVQEFSIAGVTGLRDLAYDGTYFYGGASGNTIYVMDFTNQILIGTITSPAQTVRSIAYDEDNDAFWVANWSTDITLVDRSGTVIQTIPAGTHGITSIYGSAYDNITDGGPYLWLFHQGATGTEAHIAQIDIATGTPTGVTHDVLTDLPASAPLAGGLFVTTDLVTGKATIGGIAQGTPDNMICYELGDYASWVSLDHTMGSIAPGDSGSVWVYFHGVAPGHYEGYLGAYSNDPVHPVENVHLVLDVIMTGIGDEAELMPTAYALHQNFPNPFNPSTTIKYDLKAKTDVKLTIYNVLGQKVRTLVNTNQSAGFKNIVWDGLNDYGEQVSTGVYIYRIEADNFVKSRKMVFMK